MSNSWFEIRSRSQGWEIKLSAGLHAGLKACLRFSLPLPLPLLLLLPLHAQTLGCVHALFLRKTSKNKQKKHPFLFQPLYMLCILQRKEHITTDRFQKQIWNPSYLFLNQTLRQLAKMKEKKKKINATFSLFFVLSLKLLCMLACNRFLIVTFKVFNKYYKIKNINQIYFCIPLSYEIDNFCIWLLLLHLFFDI